MLLKFGCSAPLRWLVPKVVGVGITLLLLLCAMRTGTAASPVIHLTGQENGLLVGSFFEQLSDPGGDVGVMQIRARQNGWIPSVHKTLAFGVSSATWWVRANLVNDSAKAVEEVLDLGSAQQDYVQFTLLAMDGTVLGSSLRGDRRPFPTQGLRSRTITLPFVLQPHGRAELFIRFDTHDGFYDAMPVSLSEHQAFVRNEAQCQLLLSFYHGGVLALLLFNLFMFISTRQASFGFYILYLSAHLANSFCFRGFDMEYLWPHWPGWHNRLIGASIGLSFAFGGMFVISYGRLRQYAPTWLRIVLRTAILLDLTGAALSMADFYCLGVLLSGLVGLLQTTLLVFCNAWLSFRQVREAYFLTVAYGVLELAVLAYYIEVTGVIDTVGWAMVALQAASGFEMLVLAFGLADALNVMKSQKLAAEQAALHAQQALTMELEAQVAERTGALCAANMELRRLALTDELTGAFNRRHFNNVLSERIGPDRRYRDPLGLCIFDVDHFKRYNDAYGHPAGDEALRAVAGAIRGALREADDCLFRIGGEEFAVIVRAGSADAVMECAERLRLAVESLAIPHRLNEPRVITASFGSAWWGGELSGQGTVEKLCSTADRMLYRAKETGRNRIVNALPDAA